MLLRLSNLFVSMFLVLMLGATSSSVSADVVKPVLIEIKVDATGKVDIEI